MRPFVAAHASAPDWLQAANACLARLGDIPPAANLGFLYASDLLSDRLPAILAFFKDQTDVAHWVGSVGVAVLGTGQEYYDRPALSVLLGEFPPESFRLFPAVRDDLGALAERHGAWIEAHAARFGIVHGDPRNPRTPQLVEELCELLRGGFLVGGLTSSRGAPVQIARGPTDGGLSGVLFAAEVAVATAHTQGCMPVGRPHEVTECRGNLALRLDDRPALEVFQEEAGPWLARDPAHAGAQLFVGFPVRGSDTGDYVVRNIVGFDPPQQLIAIGDELSAGETLMFCRRDMHTAHRDLVRMLRELKRRLGGAAPRGGVYFSCLGRGRHMFGENSEELRTIQQELGDLPLAGFFANGEISHNRLYGFTGVLTVFL